MPLPHPGRMAGSSTVLNTCWVKKYETGKGKNQHKRPAQKVIKSGASRGSRGASLDSWNGEGMLGRRGSPFLQKEDQQSVGRGKLPTQEASGLYLSET